MIFNILRRPKTSRSNMINIANLTNILERTVGFLVMII